MKAEKQANSKRWRRLVVLASFAALVLGLTACGGSDDDSTGSASSGTEATGGSSSTEQKEALAFVEENATGGVGATLPSKPSKAQPGKDVWILSCAQAAAGCAAITKGTNEAVQTAGWNSTVVDGQGDPSKWNATIEQARVAGVDALILIALDCGPVKQSLKRAVDSGLIVEGIANFDCDTPSQGGTEALFTHSLEMQEGASSPEKYFLTAGEIEAKWSIGHIDGEKEAIVFTSGDVANIDIIRQGFEAGFDCSECSVAGKVPYSLSELGSPITQKAQTAMLKYPQANIMASGVGPVAEYTAPAIANTGRTDSVFNTGVLTSPQNLELIRTDRGQAMGVAWDNRWLGYAGTDDLVRIFNGEEPVYSGWASGVVDTENPAEGEEYLSPVDYISNYKKLWGVS